MAHLLDRVKQYLHSPGGRRNTEKAKRAAGDPQNQAKVRRLFARFRTHR